MVRLAFVIVAFSVIVSAVFVAFVLMLGSFNGGGMWILGLMIIFVVVAVIAEPANTFNQDLKDAMDKKNRKDI